MQLTKAAGCANIDLKTATLMATTQTPQLNLALLKKALAKLPEQPDVFKLYESDEQAQLRLLPELIDTLLALSEVSPPAPIGKFIPKHDADVMHKAFMDWRKNLPHLDKLGPLVNFEPLSCSPNLAVNLLKRATTQGYVVQLSLGLKSDYSLNYLMAVVDAHTGTTQLGSNTKGGSGADQDVLDDMRPCPPCQTAMDAAVAAMPDPAPKPTPAANKPA